MKKNRFLIDRLNHSLHKMTDDPPKGNRKKRILFEEARKNYLEGKGKKCIKIFKIWVLHYTKVILEKMVEQ